jgi:hypothetical protein
MCSILTYTGNSTCTTVKEIYLYEIQNWLKELYYNVAGYGYPQNPHWKQHILFTCITSAYVQVHRTYSVMAATIVSDLK